ncbi:MAG: ASKHA domain-containing protein, partial [Acidimicrobiia bacterium]|nr:ASKHA domain-containing protein [Acidimicrobiia bacterium]
MDRGTTVLEAARTLGVDLDSVCGGRGLCGRCQVVPVGDEPPLTGPGPDEERYRRRRGLADDRRLGCRAGILGDLTVDVPPESQLHRQVVRKRVEVEDLVVDPVVRLHYVPVEPARLDTPSGATERVLAALVDEWGLGGLSVDARSIGDLQAAAATGEATVAVRDGSIVVAAWPGFRDVALGAAFDIGSTTIAGHLVDLASGETLASAGRMNPQIRFGEDLMSRVSHVMMHPEGAADLTRVVREAVDELLGELVADAGVGRTDVLELVAVGNPIMHHLLFGLDVRPLGEAPFALAVSSAIDVDAAALGVSAHPAARLHALPLIAGHVGADAAAAILSEAPHRSDALQLVVDVGTNAEIVLGSRGRVLAASSPTGPAFEGAQISSGQRAAPGAIERVRIDRDTLEPRFRVIGVEGWSDDPGFDDAGVGISGICGSGIIEAVAELYLTGLVDPDGRFASDAADRTARVTSDGRAQAYELTDGVSVTQNDVRAIQLAKAALYAGVRLLMDHLGVDEVEEIRLAGAFGSHI